MTPIVSSTFAMHATAQLRKMDMTVTDFVRELENKYGKRYKIPGYNHILRVCKGETYPGPNLLPILCDFLGFDPKEAAQWIKIDKAKQNGTAEALSKKDSQLLNFEGLWAMLNKDSKRELINLAQMKAEMDLRK